MPPSAIPKKYNVFYGHRVPSQNRPVVFGGFFTNRKTVSLPPTPGKSKKLGGRNASQPSAFDFRLWDPDSVQQVPTWNNPSEKFLASGRRLSPIARYVVDSFRQHKNWGAEVVADLRKLRRVNQNVVAEVLKGYDDPRICSKFFSWAGKQKGFHHNFSTFNALTYCLNRSNWYRAADQVVELMKSYGREPTEKQFEILVRMHSDAGRGLRVHFVYQKMKKFGCKPSVFIYNRILDALVKSQHLDLALGVYGDFKNDGCVEESITFMILIKGLCKAGRIDEAFEILDRMRRNLCKPDVFAYTAMIRTLVRAENLDGSWRVWEEMVKDGVEPDVMAYTTMICGICKVGDVEKAYRLFERLKQKRLLVDRLVYGSLITSFVSVGRVSCACSLYKEMNKLGYRADLLIYDSLIEGLCSEGELDKANNVLRMLVQEGLVPTSITVRPLIVSYADREMFDNICSLLKQMSTLGLSADDVLLDFFSFMVNKDERVLKALEAFNELKKRGYCRSSIYNVLISGLHKIGKVPMALSLFEEMKSSCFEPNSLTYSKVIDCLVDSGEILDACSYYNKIKAMSWVPTVASYCSLVKGLCRSGEIMAALSLVQDCLGSVNSGPMVFKYTLTILHACKSGKSDKVIEVLDEMMQLDIPTGDIIYCAVIYGLCKHGTAEETRKVFAFMEKNKTITDADLIMYNELLNEHLKKFTMDLVYSGLKFFGPKSKLLGS
ncbi:Pentatricopeptide repeat-containing protein [Nymphaea thermarum]|nr:Pentatricopeptide repeat-containing protein [Nymphaea thermarum]